MAEAEVRLYSEISISVVTWMEVMAGAKPRDEVVTRRVLTAFPCLPITSEVADRAYLLRRDRRLKLPDAIILATAQAAGILLVTRNTRDFSSTDPQIRVPYQI